MRNFNRLIPFIWPYRVRVAWSIFFAMLVAVVWGANLTFVFPMVEVLGKEENLQAWADSEIEATRERIELGSGRSEQLPEGHVDRRARTLDRLSAEHKRLAFLTWLKSEVLPWLPTDNFHTIAAIMGLLFLATLFKCVCVAIQTVLVGSVVELSSMQLRKACFRKCLKLDHQTLTEVGPSELMSRLTNDVARLSAGLQVFGVRLVREPLKAMVCMGLAFAWNWRLTLLASLFTPVIAIIIGRCGKHMKRAAKASMESIAGVYKVLSETFQNSRVVIAFDGGRRHRRQFHHQTKSLYKHSMKGVKVGALISPVNEFLGVLAAIVSLLPAVYMVFRGTNEFMGIRLAAAPMGIADVAVLYALLAGTLDPIHKLSGIYGQYKTAAGAADRVFELLELTPQVVQADDAVPVAKLRHSIRFESTSFSYGTSEQPRDLVLKDVNLEVSAGEVVAVLGSNGCGKSTLINLLLRFADPLGGAVLFDNIDLRRVDTRSLRKQIGLVMQETLLFDVSVYENIQYGNFDATREEIEHAADLAHVTSFLADLPEGIHTPVGVNGGRLSGGQRQRIALARALVRDPSILILDEATSAIDAQSESLIFESLRRCCKGRTVFVIAHALSPSLLDLIDRIVLMDNGCIAAMGTHAELSESSDAYLGLNKNNLRKAS